MMKKPKSFDSIVVLKKARQRFDRWRNGHKHGKRIPERLWRLAVRLAGEYGIQLTSRSLGLNYGVLKEHVANDRALALEAKPTFVEVPPGSLPGLGCSLIELEGRDGFKLRIQLRSGESLDAAGLVRSFCGVGA